MNKGNAAVEATEDEVSAVIEGNEKAEIYGHWDKNKTGIISTNLTRWLPRPSTRFNLKS